jgi:chemotaxis protein MotB
MTLFFPSCVSLKKYNDLDNEYASIDKNHEALRRDHSEMKIINSELNSNLLRLSKRTSELEIDTTSLGIDFRRKMRAYSDLSASYEMLIKNNSTTMAMQAKENKDLMERLGQLEVDLQERARSIQSRESDVLELQNLLSEKDQNLNRLKNTIASALLGYQGEGLTVEHRDGKLYVSLENSLLFASGSWTVNKNGQEAMNKLSKVLAQQESLEITVEGHTDNVPYVGSGFVKDNWDLSVLRATAIVRILTKNKGLSSKIITASGKGPFRPILKNNTPENMAANRRIEIILSPNIDKLMELLELY